MIDSWKSSGWPIVRIRDIGRLHGGGTPSRKRPEFFQGTIPWITGQDIPETHVAEISNARDYITTEAIQESATKMAPAGTVLVTTRVSVGKTAVTACPMCFSQDVTAIHIYSPAIALPKYVAHFLRSRKASLLQKNQGSTISGITRDSLALEQVPLPPISEQQRIVEILQEAEEIRRLRSEAEAKTAELIPEIYNHMFLSSEKRHTWKETTVQKIAVDKGNSIRTGPFGSDLLHSEFVDSGLPVLGIDNAVANRFRWSERRYISNEKYSDLKRFRVYPSDVMITIMGTVGRVAIAPPDIPISISTKHLCVITPDKQKILPCYLWATLLYDPTVRSQTRAVAKGAIMEGWNSKIIKALKFPLPPLSLQYQFEAQVNEIFKLEEDLMDFNLWIALNESLSSHAFSGQLTADWRESHERQLALEARERDAALKETGAVVLSSRISATTATDEFDLELTEGIYADLNREQRRLLTDIGRMVGGVSYARYFTAQTLSNYISEGPLRRNPHAIEGHLTVFAERGLVIPVSQEDQPGNTGEYVYARAFRLPLKDDGPVESEFRETRSGDFTRDRELERLAEHLKKESSRP